MVRKIFLSLVLFFLFGCVAPGTTFEELDQSQIDEAIAIIKNTELAKPVERSRKESVILVEDIICLLYTSPSPRDATLSRMPSSA